MPKVTQQHRDARREQILAAARRCFLSDGFHATSMQDLFAASGLSSGAVYSYFASKDDVIVAIAEENMRGVTEMITAGSSGGTRYAHMRRNIETRPTVMRTATHSIPRRRMSGTSERAAFRINLKDLRFLKSLGIDPTRKVRTRKPAARKVAK